MANEIGQILGEGQTIPNSPMMPTPGQAIIQAAPQQQSGLQPTPEMLKDPRFHAIGEWIRKPENMLTALVLAGSLMQDRRPGQSKMDAFAERGLGTLGVRGEFGRLNQKDKDEAAKAQSEADYRAGQIKIGQERNEVDREGVGVQREGVEAQREGNRLTRETQERMNTQDNETRLMIAQMEDGWRRSMASMEFELGRMKETGAFGLDEKTIVDIFKNYADASANGVTLPPPGETVQTVLRMKVGTNPAWATQVGLRYFKGPDGKTYVDSKPEYRALLGIPDGQGTPQAATPTAAPTKGTKEPKGKPKGYTSVPQPLPATGLPNPMLGQSVGQGTHEAPPANPSRPQLLYPGR